MKIPLSEAISLLHRASHATLASHAHGMPGYPYATVVPCVADEAHRPTFLISMLAEHTKNLLADARASLSLIAPDADNAQTAARMTLIGDVERFDASPEMRARYLRYEPEAEQYLALDFAFFRINPKRIRFIGGLGRMGWLESAEWCEAPQLTLRDEAALLQTLTGTAADLQVLGVDSFGFDHLSAGRRQRQDFPEPAASPAKALALAQTFLSAQT